MAVISHNSVCEQVQWNPTNFSRRLFADLGKSMNTSEANETDTKWAGL